MSKKNKKNRKEQKDFGMLKFYTMLILLVVMAILAIYAVANHLSPYNQIYKPNQIKDGTFDGFTSSISGGGWSIKINGVMVSFNNLEDMTEVLNGLIIGNWYSFAFYVGPTGNGDFGFSLLIYIKDNAGNEIWNHYK